MTGLIEQFGIFGVFMLMVPESACIPVPSEVTLLFSGFAVSRHWMSFCLAVLAATAGNVLGSSIAYAAGASGLPARIPGVRAVLARSERIIDERELRAVFVSRLLPLARTFVSLPAGARRVPILPFLLLTTAGCALWAAIFVLAGTLSGSAWTAIDSILGKLLLLGGAALLLVAWHRGAVARSRTRHYAVGNRRRRDHVSDEKTPNTEHPGWPSRSAEGAAARWEETHPEESVEHPAPSDVPEDDEVVPNRHSASAEAASVRWHEEHPEEE